MAYDFNADEIFEMAQQIERNGASFYRKAAESVDDSAGKELLLNFAEMEDAHEKIFAELRKDLSEKEKTATTFDPEGEAELYLRALADTRVFFEKKIDTSSMEKILREAIIAEKDSIVFYLGMKEMVAEDLGKTKIDYIIKEEMSHIKLLSGRLIALKRQ
ncbi:MAG: ferritin family protein [Deltaproteobacteria bacterium]|nr:ferritin family protein [Deltaproteobacteria bacterium]MBW2250860.1 ferritin family protein [Deltaproteobacteria bacterium]